MAAPTINLKFSQLLLVELYQRQLKAPHPLANIHYQPALRPHSLRSVTFLAQIRHKSANVRCQWPNTRASSALLDCTVSVTHHQSPPVLGGIPAEKGHTIIPSHRSLSAGICS